MIRTAITMTLPLLAQSQAWLALDQTMPCLINPITSVQAGRTLDFQYGTAEKTAEKRAETRAGCSMPAILLVKRR